MLLKGFLQKVFGRDVVSWQAFFCDLIVFLCAIWFTNLIQPFLQKEIIDSGRTIQSYAPAVGWLYLATAVAQTVGMWLLRPMIRSHQHSADAPDYGTMSFFGGLVLLVMHFTIFGFLIIWDGFKYIWGDSNGFKMILPILLCAIPTITAIIISFPGDKERPMRAKDHWLGWLGAILLTFSIVVVSQVFWHLLLDDSGKELHAVSNTANIVMVILFAFVFLLMYLPARYAFFITGYNRLSTWIGISLVYAPFARQVLLGK